MSKAKMSGLQRALALGMLLGLCAGTLHGQDAPVAEKAPTQALPNVRRTPVALPPAQPPVLVINPQQLPTNQPAKTPLTQAALFQEITMTFIYAMFFAAGIVVFAMAARFYFYVTAPTDIESLVETDPWVRAELAKADAEPKNEPKDAPTPATE
jgi:hypothetical protein